jgi:hypothetical protein
MRRYLMWRMVSFFVIVLFSLSIAVAIGPKKSKDVLDKDFTTDYPADLRLTWIGVGDVTKMTLTNTGDMGYYEQPAIWPGYDGTFFPDYTSSEGLTFEFPSGSQQFYIWDSGPWFGGKIQIDEGIFQKRTAVGAYYSENDLAPLSTIYQSNQWLPNLGVRKYVPYPELIEFPDQEIWPYTDLTINDRRNPENYVSEGQFLSDQDGYTVYGDYFPEEDVEFWALEYYDGNPLGIRVEQRTYSYVNEAIIFSEFLVQNMNADTIYDFHFGYFCDSDIGDATDDLIGYNEELEIGYTYDYDGIEDGWATSAGYIGMGFLQTPFVNGGLDDGLTGFQTWELGGEESPEGLGNDNKKYNQLEKNTFETFDNPDDVRMLLNCGAYEKLAPGQTLKYVLAFMAAEDSLDFYHLAETAHTIYENGYILPYPRPNMSTLKVDNYTPAIGETIQVSVKVEDPEIGNLDSVIVNAIEFNGQTTSLRMYDDGSHGDETPDDNWYVTEYVVPETGFLQLAIIIYSEGNVYPFNNDKVSIYVVETPFTAQTYSSLGENNILPILNDHNTEPGESYQVGLTNISDETIDHVEINVKILIPHCNQ